MFIQDRASERRFFLQVWRKVKSDHPLEPLEQVVAGVIRRHPEYHALLADEEAALGAEYPPESGRPNPFLHMGLHIAIQEQVMSDRPDGIAKLYKAGLRRLGDAHELEHRLMECLAETLWLAQGNNTLPDEAGYLHCVHQLVM